MKRILCLLMAMLLPLLPAAAEDTGADILSLRELSVWAASLKSRAMTAQPLNDPTSEDALTDDGYLFAYDFATLYMEGPEMTADNAVQAIVLYDGAVQAPGGTWVGMPWQDVVNAFYNENPSLTGARSGAVLYALGMLPRSAHVARIHRDGQRIQTIDYAVYEQGKDQQYSNAGLVYTVQDGIVTAIRAYGLNSVCASADVSAALNTAAALARETGYHQEPVSYQGSDLQPLSDADLTFAGLYFPALTPEAAEDALGSALEDTWMEDGEGYLRTMLFADCEVIFTCDADRKNPQVDSLMITVDGLEGPRAVRVGDVLHSVLNRFRHGEGEASEDGFTETLYGSEDSGTYGLAQYGADASAVLRYGVKAANGKSVTLYLSFQQLYLSEILLYIND